MVHHKKERLVAGHVASVCRLARCICFDILTLLIPSQPVHKKVAESKRTLSSSSANWLSFFVVLACVVLQAVLVSSHSGCARSRKVAPQPSDLTIQYFRVGPAVYLITYSDQQAGNTTQNAVRHLQTCSLLIPDTLTAGMHGTAISDQMHACFRDLCY